jgi:hypothetical protein
VAAKRPGGQLCIADGGKHGFVLCAAVLLAEIRPVALAWGFEKVSIPK